jgi:hypothetical protein
VLAVPGQLEHFLPASECAQLRSVFAGLYTLDTTEAQSGMCCAMVCYALIYCDMMYYAILYYVIL